MVRNAANAKDESSARNMVAKAGVAAGIKHKFFEDEADAEELTEGKAEKKIEKLRKIVKDGNMAKVEGVNIDIVTANMLIKIYDAMKRPDIKEKFSSMPIKQMVGIGWKLVGK